MLSHIHWNWASLAICQMNSKEDGACHSPAYKPHDLWCMDRIETDNSLIFYDGSKAFAVYCFT